VKRGRINKVKVMLMVNISGESLIGKEYIPCPIKNKSK
jgi:hypothetical protein